MIERLKSMMIIVPALVIAAIYYINLHRQVEMVEEFTSGTEKLIYALAGRGPDGNFIETTIEEIEDETPYYFPPGLPKETEKEWRIE